MSNANMNALITDEPSPRLMQSIDLSRQSWHVIEENLNQYGFAIIKSLLISAQCQDVITQYHGESGYRKRVVMERHGFGKGEYKYYSYPLPSLIDQLRTGLYEHLAPIANRWHRAMKIDQQYPASYQSYLQQCHSVGQTLPTPLILKYVQDDYNCLHQDLYGENVFPLQMAILLSEPGEDFEGGEFVITEQRPRMQSKVNVVPLRRGDAVIFAVNHKPVNGAKGIYRVNLRHGVSRVISGKRFTLGIILHDAQK
jgi:uncharacterized protein